MTSKYDKSVKAPTHLWTTQTDVFIYFSLLDLSSGGHLPHSSVDFHYRVLGWDNLHLYYPYYNILVILVIPSIDTNVYLCTVYANVLTVVSQATISSLQFPILHSYSHHLDAFLVFVFLKTTMEISLQA